MDKWLEELESCLRELMVEHRAMLELIGRKQQAMRRADAGAVHECCWTENAHVQRIGEIEKRRQAVMGLLTSVIAPRAPQALTVVAVADHVGEPRRGRLLVLKAQLTDLMQQVRRENLVARDATEGLLRHVQGVIQQVASAMGVGTYGRRGSLPKSGPLASTFSVTG